MAGNSGPRGSVERAENFASVVQAMEVVHHFDHPFDATLNGGPVGKGDAVPELCFEQVPSYRVCRIAGHTGRGTTEPPAISGTDFDRWARQGGLSADRQRRVGIGAIADPV